MYANNRIATALLTVLFVCGFSQQGESAKPVIQKYSHSGKVIKALGLMKEGKAEQAFSLLVPDIRQFKNHIVESEGGRMSFSSFVLSLSGGDNFSSFNAAVRDATSRDFKAALVNEDAAFLQEIAVLYPGTDTADEALEKLYEFGLKSGSVEMLVWSLEQLASGTKSQKRIVYLSRLLNLYALAGDREKFAPLAARPELKQLAAELSKTLLEGPAAAASSTAGNNCGSRNQIAVSKETRMIFRTELRKIDYLSSFFMYSSASNSFPLHVPLVSDWTVYLHNEYSLVGVSALSHTPYEVFRFTLPEQQEHFRFNERTSLGMCCDDTRVYATFVTDVCQPGYNTSERSGSIIPFHFNFPKRALIALNRNTGQPEWRIGGSWKSREFEDTVSASGEPYVWNGKVYCGVVMQSAPTDPFAHYLICADARTGRLLWKTFVCSGGTETNLFGNSARESFSSRVSIADGIVYYCSNLGAVAAMDSATGIVKWISLYERQKIAPTRSVYPTFNASFWTLSPPILGSKTLVVSPSDSEFVWGFSRESGAKKFTIRRSRPLAYALGTSGNELVICDDAVGFYDIDSGTNRGEVRLPMTAAGQGFISGNEVWVPVSGSIQCVTKDGIAGKIVVPFQYFNISVADNVLVADSFDGQVIAFAIGSDGVTTLAADKKQPDAVARLLAMYESADATMKAKISRGAIPLIKELAVTRLEGSDTKAARKLISDGRRLSEYKKDRIEFAIVEAELLEKENRFEQAVENYDYVIATYPDEEIEDTSAWKHCKQKIQAILKVAGRKPYEKLDEAAKQELGRMTAMRDPKGLYEIFRRYPNSAIAPQALFESARANIDSEKNSEAISALSVFISECKESSQFGEAVVLFCESCRKQSQIGLLRSVMKRLSSEKGMKIEMGDGTMIQISEFARGVLKDLAVEQKKKLQPEICPKFRSRISIPNSTPMNTFVPLSAGDVPVRAVFVRSSDTVDFYDIRNGQKIAVVPVDGSLLKVFDTGFAFVLVFERSLARIERTGTVSTLRIKAGKIWDSICGDDSVYTVQESAYGGYLLVAYSVVDWVKRWERMVASAPSAMLLRDDRIVYVPQGSYVNLISTADGTNDERVNLSREFSLARSSDTGLYLLDYARQLMYVEIADRMHLKWRGASTDITSVMNARKYVYAIADSYDEQPSAHSIFILNNDSGKIIKRVEIPDQIIGYCSSDESLALLTETGISIVTPSGNLLAVPAEMPGFLIGGAVEAKGGAIFFVRTQRENDNFSAYIVSVSSDQRTSTMLETTAKGGVKIPPVFFAVGDEVIIIDEQSIQVYK